MYVGGYSAQIGVYRLDAATGALSPVSMIRMADGAGPSFLATDPGHRWLFAANEIEGGGVSAYAMDRATGELTHRNDVPMKGFGPTHVSVDRTGSWVLAASYDANEIASYRIQPDGSLATSSATVVPGQNAHQIVTDPTNADVLVPCLGSDYLASYAFDAQTGAFTLLDRLVTGPAAGRPGQWGPRHLAFHPNGEWLFLAMELTSTIQALSFDGKSGRVTPLQAPLSTLRAPVAGNTGAEVQVHPSGKFVYASNRGDDTIAVFTVDGGGQLTLRSTQKCGGRAPRHFSLDPAGRWLLVANQDSNDVTVLGIEPTTGALSPPVGAPAPFRQASFVGVFE